MALSVAKVLKRPLMGATTQQVSAANFALGAAADADDYIVYAGGALFYDADGSGAAAAQRFAVFDGAPGLTVADFEVI